MDQAQAQNDACTTTARAKYWPSNEFCKTPCSNPLPRSVSTVWQRLVLVESLIPSNVTQNACVSGALVHKTPKANLLQVVFDCAIVANAKSFIQSNQVDSNSDTCVWQNRLPPMNPNDVAEIRHRLHGVGLRSTIARISLLYILERSNAPMSIGDLIEQVQLSINDRSTIARVLRDLEDLGFCRRIENVDGVRFTASEPLKS